MKISSAATSLLLSASSISAFTVPSQKKVAFSLSMADKPFFIDEITEAKTEDPIVVGQEKEEVDVYTRLGFEKSKLATGVDAEEVLQWLGTREELIAKFKKDNKGFDDERATSEVDKFMMDVEMVDKYIAFEKKKAENLARGAEYFKESREENLSDPSTLATYAIWIAGGVGLAYFKNIIAAPKYASGEWESIHITLPTPFWVNEEVASVVDESTAAIIPDEASSQVLEKVVDSVADVTSVVAPALDAVSSASDAVM